MCKNLNSKSAYIMSVVRTPIGSFKDSLASQSAADLVAVAIKACLSKFVFKKISSN